MVLYKIGENETKIHVLHVSTGNPEVHAGNSHNPDGEPRKSTFSLKQILLYDLSVLESLFK